MGWLCEKNEKKQNLHLNVSDKSEHLKCFLTIEATIHRLNKHIEAEGLIIHPKKEKDDLQIKRDGTHIKTQFEVMLDHMKLRGAAINIQEDKAAEDHNNSVSTINLTKQSIFVDRLSNSSTNVECLRETVLPYSVHFEELLFPLALQVKREMNSIHEKVLLKAIDAEAKIKEAILKDIMKEVLVNYIKELKNYGYRLSDFMNKHKQDINLERAQLMLKTPKDNLIAISKKEEMEFQMRQSFSTQSKGKKIAFERDILPYSKLKMKIAMKLPGAPKSPDFKIDLSHETFKIFFKRYFEAYRAIYNKLCNQAKLTAYR